MAIPKEAAAKKKDGFKKVTTKPTPVKYQPRRNHQAVSQPNPQRGQ
jgi:hypothetical protein